MGCLSPSSSGQWAALSSGLLSLPFLWGLQALRVVTVRAGRCAPYGGKLEARTCGAGRREVRLRVRPSCVQPRRGWRVSTCTQGGCGRGAAGGAFAWVREGSGRVRVCVWMRETRSRG